MFTKLSRLKNSYRDHSAVILASGPSINSEQLSRISAAQNIVTIGINAAPLLQEKLGSELDFLCISDLRFLKSDFKRNIVKKYSQNSKILFRHEFKDAVNDLPGDHYFVKSLGKNGFSRDLSKGYFFGSSTTIMAVQLAYYLGVKRVILLGVDLRYKRDTPRFYNEDSIQIDEDTCGVQIKNLMLARDVFDSEKKQFYSSSISSFLRPYVDYCTLPEFLQEK